MILPEKLRAELEEKRKALIDLISEEKESASKDKAFIKAHKQIRTMQLRTARVHAARAEIPLSELHYRPNGVDKERFWKVLNGIEDAWDLGLLAYDGKPNDDFLKKLVWELDPEFFQGDTGYFRRPSPVISTVPGWEHVPPEAVQELPNELYRFVTNNLEIDNFIIPEQAFLYAFHISRIQPFPDCNKRAAKMLQNLHLNFFHYPPATILEGEVDFYHRLMGEAIRGFKQREGMGDYSRQEQRLYQFLGTRVNNNLDELLDGSKYVSRELAEKEKHAETAKNGSNHKRKERHPGRKPSYITRH